MDDNFKITFVITFENSVIFDEILQILNGNLREFFETATT